MLILRRRLHLLLPLASLACEGRDLTLPTDGVVTQVEMVQGDEQVGAPGAPLEDPLIVRVTDSAGSPLSGQVVTWSVNGGGGTVDPVTDSSNSEGLALAEWILGPSPGLNVMEAQLAGSDGSPVTFTAEATAPAPQVDRLVYRFPPPKRPKEDQPFAVKVALVDADDDVVELDGILIYLGLFPEGSETPTNQVIDGSRFESTLDGLATFELTVTKKGKYRLRALTDDLPELGPHGPKPWLYSYVFEVQ
jgi:hypothetical protein